VIRTGGVDSITTVCSHLLEGTAPPHALVATRMEFTKAHRGIASDAIARIMIPPKIQITDRLDFLRIVIRVINQRIQVFAARVLIIVVSFRFQEDIQLLRVHRVIRAAFTKERRVNVMDVTVRITMQLEIQTIDNPDFQRIAIAVIDFQIQIGIVRI
jgi:hypothetical protein